MAVEIPEPHGDGTPVLGMPTDVRADAGQRQCRNSVVHRATAAIASGATAHVITSAGNVARSPRRVPAEVEALGLHLL
jgi:hypothetical protein